MLVFILLSRSVSACLLDDGAWENVLKEYSSFAKATEGERERWVSGLNQQFAKLPYGKLYRGFESPPLRKSKLHPMHRIGFFNSEPSESGSA